MRRDTIFFQLFKQFPGLLFELMDDPPAGASCYQFESVEVKETAFRIDGVFLPPEEAHPQIVCFAEIQFQKDQDLYDRFFSEVSLFLRRSNRRYDDWRGVLLFGSRSLEPSNHHLHRSLLEGPQMQSVYLDEIAQSEPGSGRSLGLELVRLTVVSEQDSVELARSLLEQIPHQVGTQLSERAIMDLITTIMVYQLADSSREEIEAMLGVNLGEPRALREERERGEEKGRQEGRQEEGRSLILRLLTRRVGALPDGLREQVEALSITQLEALGEALLDFASLADLENWLQDH